MKKWGTLLLAMVMILSFVTVYAAPTFNDMDDSWSWAAEAVESMTEKASIHFERKSIYFTNNFFPFTI